MGKSGPPPKPTELLRLSGSWRANMRKGEPQPEKGRPDMPVFADVRCEAEWERLCADLERMGVLSVVDGRAIERYVCCLIEWRDAAKYVSENGAVYTTVSADGNELHRKRPQASSMMKLGAALRRIEQEFGLTPSARARLCVIPQAPQGGARDGNGSNRAAAAAG